MQPEDHDLINVVDSLNRDGDNKHDVINNANEHLMTDGCFLC